MVKSDFTRVGHVLIERTFVEDITRGSCWRVERKVVYWFGTAEVISVVQSIPKDGSVLPPIVDTRHMTSRARHLATQLSAIVSDISAVVDLWTADVGKTFFETRELPVLGVKEESCG